MSVQTSINATLAFGFPGAHGNGQPWIADAGIAEAAVTFGTAATRTATGGFVPYDGTTFSGAFVGPHEHVIQKLPDATATVTVPAGETVAVAKKGSWFVTSADVTVAANYPTITVDTMTDQRTEVAATSPIAAGALVYAKADGTFTLTATGNAVAELIAIEGITKEPTSWTTTGTTSTAQWPVGESVGTLLVRFL